METNVVNTTLTFLKSTQKLEICLLWESGPRGLGSSLRQDLSFNVGLSVRTMPFATHEWLWVLVNVTLISFVLP